MYREGAGPFPVPLAGQVDLLVDRLDPSPDIEILEPDHPVFRIFGGERNSFLNKVNVVRYFAADRDWQPDPESTTRVIATLRNGAPLALERKYGEGRVVAFLSTLAPTWNNWARNPSFVVAMLELQSHLSSQHWPNDDRQVGAPINLQLDAAEYAPRLSPGDAARRDDRSGGDHQG